MNKTISLIITGAFMVGIGIVLLSQPAKSPKQNVEIRDGVQYITIQAGGGYSPRFTSAQAGVPTKLIVQTNGVFDCSAALTIHDIGYQNILPQSGEEVIDLGTPKQGSLQGLCSMGMYNFSVDFE